VRPRGAGWGGYGGLSRRRRQVRVRVTVPEPHEKRRPKEERESERERERERLTNVQKHRGHTRIFFLLRGRPVTRIKSYGNAVTDVSAPQHVCEPVCVCVRVHAAIRIASSEEARGEWREVRHHGGETCERNKHDET
jgi:hypothetical protein